MRTTLYMVRSSKETERKASALLLLGSAYPNHCGRFYRPTRIPANAEPSCRTVHGDSARIQLLAPRLEVSRGKAVLSRASLLPPLTHGDAVAAPAEADPTHE